MKKSIEISVLRVSSNGKYIEFIINCPHDYYFTEFTVNVYEGDDKYSLKDCMFVVPDGMPYNPETMILGDDEIIYWNKHHYSGQFKVEDLGVDHPEMYEITLIACHNESADSDIENEMEENGCWTSPQYITATAYISDVSKVYSCLMNDILSMGEKLCDNSEVTDKLIRNYLILYAHQEAMNLRELPEARKYFTFLLNCFMNCRSHVSTCHLCNGGTLTEYTTYKPSNCGCGK